MGKREYPSFIIDKERFKLRKLNEKEAYEFVKWYVDHMDERIAILKDFIDSDPEMKDKINLDFSAESLIPLNKWLARQIIKESKGFQWMKERFNEKDWLVHQLIINGNIFTNEIIKISVDIAYYWAKVFLVNYPKLYWGIITPKQLPEYALPNMPGLFGFDDEEFFQPCHMTHIVILKILDNPNECYLFDTYKYWKENFLKEDVKK